MLQVLETNSPWPVAVPGGARSSSTSEKMRLVWVCDDRYLDGTVVSIHSALSSASRLNGIEVILVLQGVSAARSQQFLRWSETQWPGVTFQVIAFSEQIPFAVSEHISKASYIRLHLAGLLDKADRAIYLDCDTLVRGDLWDFWAVDLDGAAAAGVLDFQLKCLGADGVPKCFVDAGLDPKLPYINAGILLLDLATWRAEALHTRCLQAMVDHGGEFSYHDQDALNFVLAGRWLVLPEIWNFVPSFTRGDGLPWFRKKLSQVFKLGPFRGLRDARVVHFAGAKKPWNGGVLDPGILDFRAVRRHSRWTQSRPSS